MRYYRYHIAIILTILTTIVIAMICRNTINLSDYLLCTYSTTENGYVPNIMFDYMTFADDLGGMSEENRTKLENSNDILSLLSSLFTSDYSSLTNSIKIEYDKNPVVEGDIIKVKITWDETLEKKCNLRFTAYNNYIVVKEPEINTWSSGILGALLNLELLDESKEYFSVIPLSNNYIVINPFEKFSIAEYDNNYVTLNNENNSFKLERSIFEKYFISNIMEYFNVIPKLDFSDIKIIGIMFAVNFVFAILSMLILQKITKDITTIKSFNISLAMVLMLIYCKIVEIVPLERLFLIPSPKNGVWAYVSFVLMIFVLYSLILEILTLFNHGLIRGSIAIILLLTMNVFSTLSIFTSFIILIISLLQNKKQSSYFKDKKNEKNTENSLDFLKEFLA